ncbi:sirohydrochlorin chelatase [Aidingimonas lacisalsi]|uniref:sirohydrochlorin chelatase n=1 Tax=Aidingimonas lacisalsi TaxID=2604086 RepID=UPI0011D283B6|nr:CbiX/SirB N-terminal domain-containing protein [Aidingimonas lacisalsi]
MTKALILLAHGSRDPNWRAPFDALETTLAQRQDTPLRLAYMELCSPSLEQVVADLETIGIQQADVLPLFFAAGRHLREDVPSQIEALHDAHSGIELTLLAPIGDHPAFIDALVNIIESRSGS